MSAAAGRQTRTEHMGNVPGLSAAHGHFSGEVVRAHKKRVVVKYLSSRRLIVGVVQSHQRVTQERYDQAPGLGRLFACVWRLDQFDQVSARLQGGMAAVVEDGGPFAP